MIKAIIFDCFGVVMADSLQVLTDELADTNAKAAKQARNLIRMVNKGLLQPEDTRPKIAELLGLSVDEYFAKLRAGEVKDQRLMVYISKLKASYRLGMLSNIGSDSLKRRFTQKELNEHFDVVVASGDIGFAKPEPEAYEITAERLGVRMDECVFTDDREAFCEGATSVGMHAILYTDFVQFKQKLELVLARENL